MTDQEKETFKRLLEAANTSLTMLEKRIFSLIEIRELKEAIAQAEEMLKP